MLTLRCTAKLLRRLGATPAADEISPSTMLGDWYANLLFARPAQLVLCVSERTLLPVLLPARPIHTLPIRFAGAVCDVLSLLGASADAVRDERRAMGEIAVGRTASKRVLGSMNDFTQMLDAYIGHTTDLAWISLHLADSPCSPIDMDTPRRITLARFAGRSGVVH